MAINRFIAAAADVRDKWTIEVTGTPAAGETVTVNRLNAAAAITKSVTGTIGTSATLADVATLIADMIESETALSDAATGSSDIGASQHGEFSEMTATADGAFVTILGPAPTSTRGAAPISISIAETMGAGGLTLTHTVTADGKSHWSNAKNWSLGVVPANDDTVELRDTNVDLCFGLPDASLEVTIHRYKSYWGLFGLYPINNWDPAKPYPEDRQQRARLDNAGTGTDIKHLLGLGAGTDGCNLFNLTHTGVKCSVVVLSTGTPQPLNVGNGLPQLTSHKACNIVCTEATSTLTAVKGSVDFGAQDGQTPGWASVTIGESGEPTTDSNVSSDRFIPTSMTVDAGNVTITNAASTNSTIQVGNNTTIRLEAITGTISGISYHGTGTVQYASLATITTLSYYANGLFDASYGIGEFVITGIVASGPGRLRDPYQFIGLTTDIQGVSVLMSEFVVDRGPNWTVEWP